MILYIYFKTAAGNIPAARNWAALVMASGTVRKRQAVRPVHHVRNHICRLTLLQPARRTAVLGLPYSLRPHWSAACRNNIRGKNAARLFQNGIRINEGKRDENSSWSGALAAGSNM